MSTTTVPDTELRAPSSLPAKIAWHWRNNPKIDLWIVWWTIPVFYNLFGIAFFAMAKTMPPPPPFWDATQIQAWAGSHPDAIQHAYLILYLMMGFPGWHIALIAVLLRRMSISPAFAYAYIGTMVVGTVPGALLNAFGYSLLVLRPDRDPAAIAFLYDFANLTFTGSMGVFFIGSFLLVVAILLDKNSILPKWFGYACIWNLTTEFTVAPVWIFGGDHAFAWDGGIAFYWNMVIYTAWQVMYVVVFYHAIRKMPVTQRLGAQTASGVAASPA